MCFPGLVDDARDSGWPNVYGFLRLRLVDFDHSFFAISVQSAISFTVTLSNFLFDPVEEGGRFCLKEGNAITARFSAEKFRVYPAR